MAVFDRMNDRRINMKSRTYAKLRNGLCAMIGAVLCAVALDAALSAEPSVPREDQLAAVDRFMVVDCLLPGQVRRIGTKVTYLSQRRPAKTSAGDCEVRGGEYVAYDRADYKSALNVWMVVAPGALVSTSPPTAVTETSLTA